MPRHARVTVTAGGIAVAATTDVVALEEQGYPTRYYLARDGVDMTRVAKTGKTTYCPFKGLATYYVIRGPQRRDPRCGVELRAAVFAKPSWCGTVSRSMPAGWTSR